MPDLSLAAILLAAALLLSLAVVLVDAPAWARASGFAGVGLGIVARALPPAFGWTVRSGGLLPVTLLVLLEMLLLGLWATGAAARQEGGLRTLGVGVGASAITFGLVSALLVLAVPSTFFLVAIVLYSALLGWTLLLGAWLVATGGRRPAP